MKLGDRVDDALLSEQIRSHNAMVTSETRYRRLFETAQDGILMLDAVTRQITEANPYIIQLLGYSREELLGKELWQIGLLKDEADSLAAFRELQRSGYIRYEDLPLKAKGGERREVEFVSNLYHESGKLTIQCNIRDITERKRSQEAQRASEARYRALFELDPIGVYSCDAKGVLKDFNAEATRLWGRTPRDGDTDERFCGSYRLHRPDGVYLPHAETPVADVLSGKVPKVTDAEVVIERPDGSRITVVVNIAPLKNVRQEIIGAINCFYDITDRKRRDLALLDAIAKLEASQVVAERASRAKDDFLATLSHELRTPLTPVLMTAAALRDDPRLPGDVREQLDMMERNIALEARLIDDLLDVTMISRGKLLLRQETCDAHSLIGLAVEIVRSDARGKRISIERNLDAEHTGLFADSARFQQVIWNLLRNAVKFTPENGRIVIHTRNVAGPHGENWLRIEVTDSGLGIESDHLEKIFSPFEQGRAAAQPRFGGLGLGLTIARAVVELHGGRITAASAGANQGATFIVELPSATAVPSGITSQGSRGFTDALPSPGVAAMDPLRLLLVEDHASTLLTISRLLTRAGHDVVAVSTIADALAAASQQRFDLVVSDLGLPDGTGNELMEQLRDLHGLRGIALSGYGSEEDLARSRSAGFIAHLVKPVTIIELRRVIAGFASDRRIKSGGTLCPA